MLFQVTHTTRYTYDQPVMLGPHVIRLQPRHDGAQRLLDYQLRIEPPPCQISECLDLEGNVVTHAWFSGTSLRLEVVSRFTAETLRTHPFDYYPEPEFTGLPVAYRLELVERLAPYRCKPVHQPRLEAFARSVRDEAGSSPLAFLETLTRRIHQTLYREIRDEGAPQSPERTLELNKGACRDLTMLFIMSCRLYGLAARFVSGYQKGREPLTHRYLHAWPEVYVPGGGWRGYDPTGGIVVVDEHIALAAASVPAGTMPIEGGFNGPPVRSTLDFTLTITSA